MTYILRVVRIIELMHFYVSYTELEKKVILFIIWVTTKKQAGIYDDDLCAYR